MSGLAGLFQKESAYDDNNNNIKLMLETLYHRGKYAKKFYHHFNFYAGHISSYENSQCKELEINGHYYILLLDGFISLPDSIILDSTIKNSDMLTLFLYAYHQHKEKIFTQLEGKFALIIYDKSLGKIILARDIFGQKPLYYSKKNGLSFSSELNAFKIIYKNLKISLTGLNEFLSIGYILQPNTIYEDIYSLPPASYLSYDIENNVSSIIEYYSLVDAYSNKHNDTYSDIIYTSKFLIQQSFKKLPQQNLSSGLFLSSGIDSCAIATILSNTQKTKVYTISYPQTQYDESVLAKQLAEQLQIDQHILDLSQIDILDFEKFIQNSDFVTFDNSSYPIFLLSRIASKNHSCVYTGDGGDEIFGGYITAKADQINEKLRILIPFLKRIGFQSWLTQYPKNKNDKIGLFTKIKRFSKGIDIDYQKAHYQWRLQFNPEQRVSMLGEKNRDLIYDTDPFYKFQKYYQQAKKLNHAEQHFFVDIKTWFADNNLIKLDRSTMAFGLETCSPFMDKKLFEYIAGCPMDYKTNKKILKDCFKETLPSFILNRKKSGFNSPVHQWFNIKEDEFEFYTRYLYSKKYHID